MIIPVYFDLNREQRHGVLTPVTGGGTDPGKWFHLHVDGFFAGQLHYYSGNGWYEWRFTSQGNDVGHLSDWLGEFVVLWYDSHY